MSTFDTLVLKVLDREGGYVNNPDDRGGETNFGISKRANPTVDIKNLTPEGAKAIYKADYWDTINGDALPENVRDLAFDTAVHHGPGRAKQWLTQSGNDPAKLLAIRRDALRKQGAQPGQEQFLKGWMNRMDKFEGIAPVISPVAAAVRKGPQPQVPVMEWLQGVRNKEAAREADTFTQKVKVETAPTALVKFGAGLRNSSTGRLIDVINTMQEGFEDVPDYKAPDEKLLKARSQLDLNELNKAGSDEELDWMIERQAERNERAAVIFENGMASGLGYSLLGEISDPTNWLAVYGAVKVFGASAVAAARAGETSKVLALTAAENVAAGTAVQAALQIAEGRPDMSNLLIGATADIVLGLGVGGLIASSGRRAMNAGLAERAAIEAAERELRGIEAAQATLGPGATPEALRAASSRALAGEVEAPLSEAVRPLRRERVLMERPVDDLAEEAADAADDINRAATRVDDTPTASQDITPTNIEDIILLDKQGSWADPAIDEVRLTAGAEGRFDSHLGKITDGQFGTFQSVTKLPEGVTVTKALQAQAAADPNAARAVSLLRSLADEYLLAGRVKSRIVFGSGTTTPTENGVITSFGRNHVIGVRMDPNRPSGVRHTTIHELGHAVYHERMSKVPVELANRIKTDWLEWVQLAKRGDEAAVSGRFGATSPNADLKQLKLNDYNLSLDEWMAEQFVKHVEGRWARGDYGKTDKGIVNIILTAIKDAFRMFSKSKQDKLVEVSASADEFFTAVLNKNVAQTGTLKAAAAKINAGPATNSSAASQGVTDGVNDFLQDPVAKLYGLDLIPLATSAQRAEAKAMLALAKKAEEWSVTHPKDAAWDKRADNLIDNSIASAASTGLKLLKSENPIARMIASELLEDASGVAGTRASTAALSKHLMQRHFMGNTLNDIQGGYELWAKANRTNIYKDQFTGGKGWETYNRQIAEEIEARRNGSTLHDKPYIQKAADSLEAAYTRMAKAQKDAKTLGHQALWDNSRGYMPHKISPSKWLNMSNNERRVVHSALVDQFVSIKGWDVTFSDKLASEYLQRVRARAIGGHDSPIGGSSSGSASIVEDALLSLNMTQQEVRENMKRFNRGAASFTKERLDLDLLKMYTVDGKQFRLMDVYDTDQTALVRGQANRASGEVALARHGVYGKPGLMTVRNALGYSPDGKPATARELDAYDQVAAEFMDEPFGNQGPKWLDNARALTSVVRLGGIVFNQFGEFVNGVAHLGVTKVLAAGGAMPRLRKEIKALARGEQVDNSLLGSIERLGGAEFGTDSYKIVMPFDQPGHAYQTYAADTVGNFTKLVRGASYAQSKVSLWRAVHSVQQRGMAEQVVAKIARYTRDGGEDIALSQFGITPEMQAALRADGVARWDNGSLVEFDVTKIKDPQVAEDLIHAVHRGVSQIIQGTFIGETGKWAHDGYLKAITQFRTFSLTSMEKQWGRQRNSRGQAAAVGILLTSAAMVTPVYVARVYAASIGREDQEEFLEKRLAPEMIARQTLNYVALSGLLGDFFDGVAAIDPTETLQGATGGRTGSPTGFVGTVIAPSAGLIDDAWKATQQLDDPEKMMKVIPGSRLPYIVPIINSFGD